MRTLGEVGFPGLLLIFILFVFFSFFPSLNTLGITVIEFRCSFSAAIQLND